MEKSKIKKVIIEIDDENEVMEVINNSPEEYKVPIINSLINHYKIEYMKIWEKDHNVKNTIYDKKISNLNKIKKELDITSKSNSKNKK